MEDKTRTYTAEEILFLSMVVEHVDVKSEDAFKWLMENHCVELAAMCDALVFRRKSARDWLEKNGYSTLVDFLDALDYDEDAISDIMKGPHKEWAAVLSIVNDDDNKALIWLVKSGLRHFVALAEVLKNRANSNSRTGYGGISSGSSGGVNSTGFGGFGGGSFGGAGAGGVW